MTLLPLLLVLAAPPAFRERPVFPKPAHTQIDPDRSDPNELVLKLHEGTRVRLRNGELEFDPKRLGDEDRRRMARQGLSEPRVAGDVLVLNDLLFRRNPTSLVRLFQRAEEDLDAEHAVLEPQEAEELADLNLYFVVLPSDARASEAIVDAANALASVELCYPEPIPSQPNAVDIAPPTLFTNTQGYKGRTSFGGIDADWANRLPGGKGGGIRVIDVESGWVDQHEDIPNLFAFNGVNFTDFGHGIAVLGIIGAAPNAYGATGIAPEAALGASSVWSPQPLIPHGVANAIDNAASHLLAGDVMLIEQHHPEPGPIGILCTCNCSQFGFLPEDSLPAPFDAIRNATARGIVVVEAAGNGSMNLDHPSFNLRFDRTVRDSRAIMVGAGNAVGGLASCGFSNHGSRLDVQAWGANVGTLGGDGSAFMANGPDFRQWYTQGFSGTSSAAAIVAGAVATVNGSRRADGLPVLFSHQMRTLLSTTGITGTAPLTMFIGPRLNLRAALPAVTGDLQDITGLEVKGFAFQSNQPTAPVTVQIWIDGALAGTAVTGFPSPLFNVQFDITGDHEFRFPIPNGYRDGLPHSVRAFVLPVPGSGLPQRELRDPKSFTLKALKGELEGVSSRGQLRGWAYAYAQPTTSVQLHIFDPDQFVFLGSVIANVPRSDVNAAEGITGSHGFDFALPFSTGDGATHRLIVIAVNPLTGAGEEIGTIFYSWRVRFIPPFP